MRWIWISQDAVVLMILLKEFLTFFLEKNLFEVPATCMVV